MSDHVQEFVMDDEIKRRLHKQTDGVLNVDPLAYLNLSGSDLRNLERLARLLRNRYAGHQRRQCYAGIERTAFVVGINAPPGSGKSTLVHMLKELFRLRVGPHLRIAHISSDDLYIEGPDWEGHGISTRLDPRSLDPALKHLVGDLKYTQAGVVNVPRFNKSTNLRECTEDWECPLDIVLYEGWRVGVQAGDVQLPCGKIVNFDWSTFNAAIDLLIYVAADPEDVKSWKMASTKRDLEKASPPVPWDTERERAFEDSWRTWILPFVQQHEMPLASVADVVITKDSHHHITRLEERIQRWTNLLLQSRL